MVRVTKVQALSNWRLDAAFSDGLRGEASLVSRLFGPVFEPLRDTVLFAQASVDEFGAICWPNGADLAPDALYAQITARNLVA